MDSLFVSFNVAKAGKQFLVYPEERYRDENGVEKTRWINSGKIYFDTIEDALKYVLDNSIKLID